MDLGSAEGDFQDAGAGGGGGEAVGLGVGQAGDGAVIDVQIDTRAVGQFAEDRDAVLGEGRLDEGDAEGHGGWAGR